MKQYLAGAMLLISICSAFSYTAHAQRKQGQARLDSLLAELPKMHEDTAGVKLLYALVASYNGANPDESLKYATRQQALARKIGWRKGEMLALNGAGNAYLDRSAYPDALDAFLKALRISEALGDKEYTGVISLGIAQVYLAGRNYDKAQEYLLSALKIAEERGDKKRIRSALGNLANVYGEQNRPREALEVQMRVLRMAEEMGDKRVICGVSDNIGITYGRLQEYNNALRYHFQALHSAKEIDYRVAAATALTNIGNTYRSIATDSIELHSDSLVPATRAEALSKAVEYLDLGIAGLRATGQRENLHDHIRNLFLTLEAHGDYKSALQSAQEAVALRDSIFNKENDTRLIRTEEGYKFSKRADSLKWESDKRALAIQKETELAALAAEYAKKQAAAKTEKERQDLLFEEDLKRQQIASSYREKEALAAADYARKATLAKAEEEKRATLAASEIKRQKTIGLAAAAGGVIMLLIAGIAFRAFRQRRASNLVIAGEREKSEALLRNILPAEVAEELKDSGSTQAKQFDAVSVLFTDFVDFTETSERLSPTALVKELHECFSAFDAIIDKHGLEKIKTIGDAYMAVCGLPNPDPRHAQNCVQAAIDIRDFMYRRHARSLSPFGGGPRSGLRIGINSGPVVAGIVGVKKFAYDIWGDTVNTAARMEQAGEPGRINISHATYELVKDDFPTTHRGALAAKGKGEVDMYFIITTVTDNVGLATA